MQGELEKSKYWKGVFFKMFKIQMSEKTNNKWGEYKTICIVNDSKNAKMIADALEKIYTNCQFEYFKI